MKKTQKKGEEIVLPKFIVQDKRQEPAIFLEFKGRLENKRGFFFPFFF